MYIIKDYLMSTKIMLTLNDKVIESAKKYSKKNNISLSEINIHLDSCTNK